MFNMHWRMINSSIKLTLCSCSRTSRIQLLSFQRQTKVQRFSNCSFASSLTSRHLQPSVCFGVSRLMTSHRSVLTQTDARLVILQHRFYSQYVDGARYLERLKEDEKLCEEALRLGQFAVFYDLKALVHKDGESRRAKLLWIGADDLKDVVELVGGLDLSDAVLLSSSAMNPDQPAKFAINIPKADDDTLQQSLERLLEAEIIGIRRALFTLGRGDNKDFVQAHALLQWHSHQAFCSKCGARNSKNLAGNRRICSSCKTIHYPTMKPIVITLVTNGDRCLVARQPQFPSGMYSALAGFCDMGETLEDAVRREVAEEVGLEVDNISYHSSQHWPLPTSGLMLGCYASVKDDNDQILIDKNELEDAKWVEREEVQRFLQQIEVQSSQGQSSVWFPPKSAIAYQLISRWAFKE